MLFSILVVSLNPGDKLLQTLQSIEKQTCRDYEVIIKDGGSTDTPHDYRVACVAKSLNSTAIAIKRVNVSGA